MPVLPLVGSMMTVSAWISPSRSAASIIARAMRSLTLHSGFMFSILPSHRGDAAGGHPPQPHQRRVADALGDVVEDAAGMGDGHGVSPGGLQAKDAQIVGIFAKAVNQRAAELAHREF